MSILGWFRKKKQNKNIKETLDKDNLEELVKSSTVDRHQAIDLCEQLIDSARLLEDEKQEYQTITRYLTDIETIEAMPQEDRNHLVDLAKKIETLDSTRSQLLNSNHRISDEMYAKFQEEEAEIPGIVKRLQSNETYLAVINKDLRLLEGEKVEQEMAKANAQAISTLIRRLSAFMTAFFVLLVALLFVIGIIFEHNMQLFLMMVAFLAVLYAVIVLIKYQDSQKKMIRCDNARNRAISLENHIKIKYVNIKNAVDYTCDRFKVTNSYELIYQYEQYQESVKERRRFRETSEDLMYYSEHFIRILARYQLYDSRVWLHRLAAIIDSKEMVEVKHDYLVRRQKIRSSMEEQMNAMEKLATEIEKFRKNSNEELPEITKVLNKVKELNIIRS